MQVDVHIPADGANWQAKQPSRCRCCSGSRLLLAWLVLSPGSPLHQAALAVPERQDQGYAFCPACSKSIQQLSPVGGDPSGAIIRWRPHKYQAIGPCSWFPNIASGSLQQYRAWSAW